MTREEIGTQVIAKVYKHFQADPDDDDVGLDSELRGDCSGDEGDVRALLNWAGLRYGIDFSEDDTSDFENLDDLVEAIFNRTENDDQEDDGNGESETEED
jgi:hypothetical protein